jgi:divalent metal cation (Fe/Co/Zn/Cd) transporter
MFLVDVILSGIWAITMIVTILSNWQWILTTTGGVIGCYLLITILTRFGKHTALR